MYSRYLLRRMNDARDLGNDDRQDGDAREMKLEMLNGDTWRLHLHYAPF